MDPLCTPADALDALRDEWSAATTDAERVAVAVLGQAVSVIAEGLRHPADRRTR